MNIPKIPLLFVFNVITFPAVASHLLGGYLSYRWVSGDQYEITVRLITDNSSQVSGGDGTLDFGDGDSQTAGFNVSAEEIDNDASLLTFSVLYTYARPGSYEISYTETNYNLGIVNMEFSGSTPFFITARLETGSSVSGNNSPRLKLFQLQRGITGVAQRINPAAWDEDGDSLSYELIVPREATNRQIQGYSHPNDSAVYNDHERGNEANDGIPMYSVSPATGEILWDAPALLGEYVIAFKITQWRRIANDWVDIGENEVILINHIVDAPREVSVTHSVSQCFDDILDVNGQFLIDAPASQSYTISVFSDLEGALINSTPVDPNEILTFNTATTDRIALSLPSGVVLASFRLYRVIITIETNSKTVTASWAFAVGCESLPDDVSPPPIIREETCDELVVYPNPSHTEGIEICLPVVMDEPRHIRIVDTTGKLVFEKSVVLSTSTFELDTGTWPSGLYILQIDRSAWKFLVQR